ncbi:MAG: hypothetical protein A2064_11340 [Spirochaetes bacterium GWB1_66_5]|nr:MAG: hypothetical protein A2064_11340 [Spirochaetes bacterium GWB1_66_5]
MALLAVLSACQPPVSPPLDEEAGDAEAKAAALIGAVMEGKATGDFGAVETILAQDDMQGELREVLAEAGALAGPTARSTEQPVRIPWLGTGAFQTGDVLVCRGSGTLTSNLMDLVLVNGYAHAGIYQDLGTGVDNCILSADVDYLTEGTGEALNYESWLDWIAKNDVITLLRPPNGLAATDAEMDAVGDFRDGHTVYAFLGYPGAPVGAFQPIPRDNPDYWYCSKVPARVYDLAYGVPLEDLDFHWENHGSGPRWWVVRQSLLYRVYVVYLKLMKPWWPLFWCAYKADLALQGVLAELVTPDELRASGMLVRQFSATPTSDSITEAEEAALLGWDTYQD